MLPKLLWLGWWTLASPSIYPFAYEYCARQIAKVLDSSDVRRKLALYCSNMGRPSLDPELMIRMPLVGYLYGVRSERRLVEEVYLNLAYRWFRSLRPPGKPAVFTSAMRTRPQPIRRKR